MRKIIRVIFLIMALNLATVTIALAAPAIVFNGKIVKYDVPPIIQKGVTLVPLRVILETFGAQVNYIPASKKITVVKDNLNIALKIGDKTAAVNGKMVALSVAPQLINTRTFVPMRFISEALNAEVNWNSKTNTVEITYHAATGGQLTSAEIMNYEKEIFKLVNEIRKEFGLQEFVWVDELASVARAHSADMANQKYFDHTSPTAGSPADRSRIAGLPGIGENIAAGPMTAKEVHEAWMNSSGHRKNILNPDYRFIGIGIFSSSDPNDAYGGKYFTENFIPGEIFLTSPYTDAEVKTTTITVTGYSVAQNPKLTIYKLLDDKTYSESYDVPLMVIGNKFSQQIELKYGKGEYAIWASGFDVRNIILK